MDLTSPKAPTVGSARRASKIIIKQYDYKVSSLSRQVANIH